MGEASGIGVRRDEDSWRRDTACLWFGWLEDKPSWGGRWLRKVGLTELGLVSLVVKGYVSTCGQEVEESHEPKP